MHIHGTLWVDLPRIERPLKLKNGKLVSSEKKGKMEGLSGASQKIKNLVRLSEEDTKCSANFVDLFITAH